MSGTTEVYWTSDLHFSHNRILDFCRETRQGDTPEEMNELIIERWNMKVRPGDIIHILGDISFDTVENTIKLLKRLQGAKHVIRGNHDHVIDKVVKLHPTMLHSYKTYNEIKVQGEKFTLCHFPVESWNCQRYGAKMLHGHTHLKDTGETPSHGITRINNRMDVGLDTRKSCDMNVYHHSEVLAILKERYVENEDKK